MRMPPKSNPIPVLLGVRSKAGGMLKLWCPYCRVFHNNGNVEGPRVAHCYVANPNSPFVKTGYWVVDGTKILSKLVKEASPNERS